MDQTISVHEAELTSNTARCPSVSQRRKLRFHTTRHAKEDPRVLNSRSRRCDPIRAQKCCTRLSAPF